MCIQIPAPSAFETDSAKATWHRQVLGYQTSERLIIFVRVNSFNKELINNTVSTLFYNTDYSVFRILTHVH